MWSIMKLSAQIGPFRYFLISDDLYYVKNRLRSGQTVFLWFYPRRESAISQNLIHLGYQIIAVNSMNITCFFKALSLSGRTS